MYTNHKLVCMATGYMINKIGIRLLIVSLMVIKFVLYTMFSGFAAAVVPEA